MSTAPFVTVCADPPWAYNDHLTMSAVKRGSAANYPTMSVQQICDLYTPSSVTGGGKVFHGTLAGHPLAFDGFLCLWVTKDILLEGIGQRVAMEWGYTPKQIVPWVKGRIELVSPRDGCHDLPNPQLVLQMGMGRIFRNCVEYLLICTRGKYTKLVQSKSKNGFVLAEEDHVILAPRANHSTKPEDAYQLIESVCPAPRLELFARRAREGWTVWGNEVAAGGQPFERADEPRLRDVEWAPEPLQLIHPHPPIEWP